MTHRTIRPLALCLFIALLFLLLPHPALAQDVAAAPPPTVPHGTVAQRVQSFIGLLAFTSLAWLIGRAMGTRTDIRRRTLIWGMLLQFIFGAIVVWNRVFLIVINHLVDALLGFTAAGAKVVFGNLINNNVPVGP